MSSSADQFENALIALSKDVASALDMEQKLSGKSSSKAKQNACSKQDEFQPRLLVDILKGVLETCNNKRKLETIRERAVPSDEQLSYLTRFTDKFRLVPYRNFLHFVPRIVNVVSVSVPTTH